MLRSTLFTALVASALPAVAAAQPVSLTDEVEVGADRLELGPQVGAAFIGLHGDVTASIPGAGVEGQNVPLESALGLVAGGFVELGITAQLGLRVEGYYARERATANLPVGNGGPFGGGAGVSIAYLRAAVEVPVLAVWRIPYDAEFVPRVFGGPYLGIGVGGSVDAEASIPDPEMMGNDLAFDDRADLGDDADSLQVGVVVGASMSFPLPLGELVGQVRYHAAITPVVGEHELQLMGGAATVSGESLRDRGLVLILGWQL